MKQIKEHLEKNKIGQLATVKNGQANQRPFQFIFEKDNMFYFMTSNTKNVYRELVDNPTASFITLDERKSFTRVRGEIEFVKELSLKEEILDKEPMVKMIYKSADNPIMEVFRIHTGVASLHTGTGQVVEEVEFKRA